MKSAWLWAIVTVAALGLLSACSGGDAGPGGDAGGAGGAGGSTGVAGSDGSGGVQTLDRSNISFVDNLLVKVADQEWTLGEGLVATLEVMAGERNAESILRHAELLNNEGTGIIRMAFEYLDTGPDEQAKGEIRRLLDFLVFSTERLEAMAGLEPVTPAALLLPKGSADDCGVFFSGYDVPPGVGTCLEVRSSPTLEEFYPGDFRVFGPASPFPTVGWNDHHFDLALLALEATVPVYKGLGNLMPVSIVFSVRNNPPYAAQAAADTDSPPDRRPCGIVLYLTMQQDADGDFQQIIAHELAHCFQQDTFPEQNRVPYEIVRWREEGLAEYLSNVVYPGNNLEWGAAPARRHWIDALQRWELASTVFERSYTNFMFFQYLGNRLGDGGVIALVSSLPTSGGTAEQAARLAQYPGMSDIYHDFAKALTDMQVIDDSGVPIPYQMTETNRPTVTVTDPTLIMEDFQPFSVSRYHLAVDTTKEALLAFSRMGQVRDSTRAIVGFDWGELPLKLPDERCSEMIMVVTTTAPGTGFELDVPEVRDASGLCVLEGEWLVDNDTLNVRQAAFELQYVRGEIRGTFREDGTLDVIYDNWEYQVSRETQLSVGGIDIERYEEFTYTTNAQGTTTYEFDGNSLEFGDFFEIEFLSGMETVHWIKRDVPPNVVGEEIDRVLIRDPQGDNIFVGVLDYELSGDSLTLFQHNRAIGLTR